MLVRWLLAAVLILGLLITAFELSAGARGRAHARRPASVADIVTGRGEDPSVPNAPEVDESPSSTSPAITY
ncbi:MAG TPA: hypothetical protein VE932_04855 [Patescibacteria group bacterium]|nr:hypothetical protein [Patescibacteria group bacterium]